MVKISADLYFFCFFIIHLNYHHHYRHHRFHLVHLSVRCISVPERLIRGVTGILLLFLLRRCPSDLHLQFFPAGVRGLESPGGGEEEASKEKAEETVPPAADLEVSPSVFLWSSVRPEAVGSIGSASLIGWRAQVAFADWLVSPGLRRWLAGRPWFFQTRHHFRERRAPHDGV